MIPVLLWIVGCYALAAAAVHAASVWSSKRNRNVQHFVLIAGNEQLQMEWYMRSLRRFSHFTGQEVKVTVVDHGSEDETIGIARFFARYGMKVDIKSGAPMAGALNGALGESEEAKPMNDSRICQEAGNNSRETEPRQNPKTSSIWQRFRAALSGIWKGPVIANQAKGVEPTSLMWMLQAEGIITESEHAVLIDLRDPAEVSRLPL
ncbi:hypothetical protein ACFPYJ_29045 [Paenibacillus solisilvae]|uniref:Glycosyltransferase 2-like domain-containing protein n=1 Tax=Paenibacillus solisilvae TaxID=2486751 RepID=A0ABW0W4H0_9BACL